MFVLQEHFAANSSLRTKTEDSHNIMTNLIHTANNTKVSINQ